MSMALVYIMIVAGNFLGALASYFFKGAAEKLTHIFDLVKSKGIWIGGIIYIVALINNIFVLKFLDYSVVLPLASLTYIFTMLLANHLLHERITKHKIFGVALIIMGAILLAIG